MPGDDTPCHPVTSVAPYKFCLRKVFPVFKDPAILQKFHFCKIRELQNYDIRVSLKIQTLMLSEDTDAIKIVTHQKIREN